MNLALPNPAQQQDAISALLEAVLANQLNPVTVTVAPTNGGSTTQTYVVVAKTNGDIIPSAATSTTAGAATLSSTAFNTLNWTPLQGVNTPVFYDVYRTAGGVAQGLIASNLTGTTLVDNGLVANTSPTTPPFNTSGLFAASSQEQVQVCAASGAITLPAGKVMVTDASAAALTLAQPIAGAVGAGGHDGCRLRIYSTTAGAHTVTTAANGIEGSKHIATFGGAIGDFIDLEAYNGTWWPAANTGVTLS